MTYLRKTKIQGEVCSCNSSATPLLSGATYTGTAKDITDAGILFVNISTDVASATDGLSIQQSSDGTNWDHTDDFTIPANGNKNFSINPHCQYMRVVYTNGTSDQTHFRLQTVYKSQNAKPSSHRVKDTIIGDDDVTIVKAALTGENGDGLWHNVKTTADGNLTISDKSSGLAIAQGDVTDTSFIHKFGETPSFAFGDNEVHIWDGADDTDIDQMTYVFATGATIDSVSSSNDTDVVDVEIQGLDSGYTLVNQTITLSGQTRVALSTNLLRVFRVKNVGSTDLVGNTYVYENTAISGGVPTDTTKVKAVIQNGNNQTLMTIYTVPAGKTAYLRGWYASTAGASKSSQYVMRLKARPFGQVFQLKHISSLSDVANSHIKHDYIEPEVFTEKTDIVMTTQATAAGATGAAIAAGFDIVLVNN